jgi:hypothetical protein
MRRFRQMTRSSREKGGSVRRSCFAKMTRSRTPFRTMIDWPSSEVLKYFCRYSCGRSAATLAGYFL